MDFKDCTKYDKSIDFGLIMQGLGPKLRMLVFQLHLLGPTPRQELGPELVGLVQ